MNAIYNTRRNFLKQSVYAAVATINIRPFRKMLTLAAQKPNSRMRFGLVTYLWGKDWDLPTLIANCENTEIFGVELRTQHTHGVESNLTAQQRREVRKRFDDSPVTLVGLGTNFAFHYPDAEKLRYNMEGAKAYIKLSHDVGGSGIKVKPNDLPAEVSRVKTIERIGESLNELGRFGSDYGQEIRLEVHGGCSPLHIIKEIMDVANNSNVGVCWNCNKEDLDGESLEYNFRLVRDRFGNTLHVRELNTDEYPYQKLMNILVETDYTGWVLLEARTNPIDRIKALIEQRQIWEQMLVKAQKQLSQQKQQKEQRGVKISESDNKLRVEINGRLFTEYNYKNVPRPFFYPVIGPTGANITRSWPMEEGEHEEHDHPHHRSLWFTHGEVNGQDFWLEDKKSGKIVHEKFLDIKSSRDVGIVKSLNKWIAADGTIVCTDTRTYKFYNRQEGQLMDFEVTIHASQGQVTFGDTKEGSMAIRVVPAMRVEGEVGKGHIINSEGNRDKKAWGKRAAWCDYYGPIDGNIIGIAIFDHPDNPRHPTWWHVRTYGLFAANPFGVHYFEGKPKGTGDMVIPSGQSLTFKYRFYLHEGNEKQGQVAEYYREYSETK